MRLEAVVEAERLRSAGLGLFGAPPPTRAARRDPPPSARGGLSLPAGDRRRDGRLQVTGRPIGWAGPSPPLLTWKGRDIQVTPAMGDRPAGMPADYVSGRDLK